MAGLNKLLKYVLAAPGRLSFDAAKWERETSYMAKSRSGSRHHDTDTPTRNPLP